MTDQHTKSEIEALTELQRLGQEYDASSVARQGDKCDEWDFSHAPRTPASQDELVQRLIAASHDERLSTGALYREAAEALTTLQAELDTARYEIQSAETYSKSLSPTIATLRTQLDEARLKGSAIDDYAKEQQCLRAQLSEARLEIARLNGDAVWEALSAAIADKEMLRESLEDCVAVIRGALSGPVQVASVLKEADAALATFTTKERKLT